jgi:hypothetical protein
MMMMIMMMMNVKFADTITTFMAKLEKKERKVTTKSDQQFRTNLFIHIKFSLAGANQHVC